MIISLDQRRIWAQVGFSSSTGAVEALIWTSDEVSFSFDNQSNFGLERIRPELTVFVYTVSSVTEATIRFLKAKLRVMQEEVDRLAHECSKKVIQQFGVYIIPTCQKGSRSGVVTRPTFRPIRPTLSFFYTNRGLPIPLIRRCKSSTSAFSYPFRVVNRIDVVNYVGLCSAHDMTGVIFFQKMSFFRNCPTFSVTNLQMSIQGICYLSKNRRFPQRLGVNSEYAGRFELDTSLWMCHKWFSEA